MVEGAPIVVSINAKLSIDLKKVIKVQELVADNDGVTPVVPLAEFNQLDGDTIMVQIFYGHNLMDILKEPSEVDRFLAVWHAFEWIHV